jgi:hypothetical protein
MVIKTKLKTWGTYIDFKDRSTSRPLRSANVLFGHEYFGAADNYQLFLLIEGNKSVLPTPLHTLGHYN